MKRRYLLVTTALGSASIVAACKETPGPPANPKGSMYDASRQEINMPANPKGSRYDDGLATPPPADAATPEATPSTTATLTAPPPSAKPTATPTHKVPLPANPKGSRYDHGLPKPKP